MPITTFSKSFNEAVTNSKKKTGHTGGFDNITKEGRELGYDFMKAEPGKSYTVYIPDLTHTEPRLDDKGNPVLDEDGDPIIDTVFEIEQYDRHSLTYVRDGRVIRGNGVRCVSHIKYVDESTGEMVLDGECPACKALFEVEMKLAKEKIKRECDAKGISFEDKQNPDYKAIARKMYGAMSVSKTTPYYCMPMYVVEMEKKSVVDAEGRKRTQMIPVFQKDADGNFLKDEDGHKIPSFKRMWKRLNSKNIETMTMAAKTMGGDSYGGYVFTFSFPQVDNKMTAGKDMIITCGDNPKLKGDAQNALYTYLDKDARKHMRPEDARVYMTDALIYTKKEIEDKVAKAIEEDQKSLLMMMNENAQADETKQSIADDLASFGVDIAIED